MSRVVESGLADGRGSQSLSKGLLSLLELVLLQVPRSKTVQWRPAGKNALNNPTWMQLSLGHYHPQETCVPC